jgi:hypothetical protein
VNHDFAFPSWPAQTMIFQSKVMNKSKQAANLQTIILKIIFIVGKCDWIDARSLKSVPLDATQSVCATLFANLCCMVFNETPNNEVNLPIPIYTNMSMRHFSKHFTTNFNTHSLEAKTTSPLTST